MANLHHSTSSYKQKNTPFQSNPLPSLNSYLSTPITVREGVSSPQKICPKYTHPETDNHWFSGRVCFGIHVFGDIRCKHITCSRDSEPETQRKTWKKQAEITASTTVMCVCVCVCVGVLFTSIFFRRPTFPSCYSVAWTMQQKLKHPRYVQSSKPL